MKKFLGEKFFSIVTFAFTFEVFYVYNNIIFRKREVLYIYERMLSERKRLEEQIQLLQEKLRTLPEGKLICSGSSSNCKWFQSDGHVKTYIPKKNRLLAERLATKKYFTFLLEDLENEKKAIEFYLRHHSSYEPKASRLLDDSSEFQNLLTNHFSPLSKELDDWMKSPYEHNLKHPEHLVHKISATEFVRSKSEAIIGKVLRANKIPFRYEASLTLNGIVIYPDFTIRHPKTGEFFYWEHFGLMDNPTYVKNTYGKLQLYTENQVIPSVNLITTYETKERPLVFEQVELLINYYFL